MSQSPRCLYDSSFAQFNKADEDAIFGVICDKYNGEALTTTREAWRSEIQIIDKVFAHTVFQQFDNVFRRLTQTRFPILNRSKRYVVPLGEFALRVA